MMTLSVLNIQPTLNAIWYKAKRKKLLRVPADCAESESGVFGGDSEGLREFIAGL